jgi:phenylpropionate dioxygenase-like ring-hydroxylating dioxygenase large terminal subunit
MNIPNPGIAGIIEAPVKLRIEPYVSADYARAEKDKLWGKVWQIACREEEIPNPGDYYTYDIHDQSIIVVRLHDGGIAAHHNVCRHRGKRLTAGCGRASHFHCSYHGWQWNLRGENIRVLNPQYWNGALDGLDLGLGKVQVGCWGGYVFINLDPDCGPLEEYLQPLSDVIGPLDLGGMRYKWRKWLRYPANWKVVTEAFIEGYHAPATHPQTLLYGGGDTAGTAEGLHARMWLLGVAGGGIGTSFGKADKHLPREIPYLAIKQQADTIWSNYSETLLAAAKQVSETLPETATAGEAGAALMQTAYAIDAARGVHWPAVAPEHLMKVGINWHMFPNVVILPNMTFALGFRVRPDGFDPDSCITEVYALERYPEGDAPATEWEHAPDMLSPESWPLLLRQDFRQMNQVQQGMRSGAIPYLLPNPLQEAGVVNLQRNLAAYMGEYAPEPIT